jgi:hypothetical protein
VDGGDASCVASLAPGETPEKAAFSAIFATCARRRNVSGNRGQGSFSATAGALIRSNDAFFVSRHAAS